MDEETVRKRIERLTSSGLLRGWNALVNPHLFGVTIYALWIAPSSVVTTDDAIRKIRLVHGVSWIGREVGGTLGIGLFCENDRIFQKRVELIKELTGATVIMTNSVVYPKPEVDLTHADWELIKKLRLDPSPPYNRLAQGMGVSSRTVMRRLTRLMEGKAIVFVSAIDFKRLEGATAVDVFVFYAASKYKSAVDRGVFAKFQDYLWRAGWGGSVHGHFTFLVPSASVAQEIVGAIGSMQGVQSVRFSFLYDSISFWEETLDEMIRTKVDSGGRG